jgi:hypothetical protein
VTYSFDCGAAGTISATVQGVSADDAFHVTSVSGGDGTVVSGDLLVNTSYLSSNGSSFNIAGFNHNELATISCSWMGVRTGTTASGTFYVAA